MILTEEIRDLRQEISKNYQKVLFLEVSLRGGGEPQPMRDPAMESYSEKAM